jgi:Zn-dependent peptidase ImmA (M78 family)/transcriptional regulator with XRE-family HTH domain
MTENEKFNPEMLLLARELRELTQAELAERAGMTQGFLSQLEHGEKTPTPDRIEKLAQALSCPSEFFCQAERYSGFGLSLFYYRKRASAQVSHLRRLQAEANVRRILVGRLLRGFKLRTSQSFQRLDVDEHDGDAEKVAQFARAGWSMPVGPVRNLVAAIEAAGGLVFKFSFGTRDIDAMSQWPDDGLPLFFINSDAPADRVRFSLAHELGHVLMHRTPSDQMEVEADRFASEFLMPSRDIAPELTGLTLQRAAALKPAWRVSMAALVRRARDLGKIPELSYTNLFKRMSALGYRKQEPNPIGPEEPRLIPTLLEAYQAQNGFTVAEMARVSRVSEDDFAARFVPRSGLRLA